jgi:hypothetical protein
MCARTVSLPLQPNSVAALPQTMENDLLPWLQQQPGFHHESVCVIPGGSDAVASSGWE